jgi:MYXO-CTERM domain-containing protein
LAANGLLHAGERSLATGLALLVLFGRRRRRSRPQLPLLGLPD